MIKIIGRAELLIFEAKVKTVMPDSVQLENDQWVRLRDMARWPQAAKPVEVGATIRFSMEADLAREKGLIPENQTDFWAEHPAPAREDWR